MLISIVVPIYKVEKYIHRCIESILAQTFTDFELILVDDGSPDNCGKICDEYAEKDNRIHVIHKENGGLSDARNTGIDWAFANSNSDWITFIDSDDWIHPKYMEALYNAVNETGCEISICGYEETTVYNPIVDDSKLQAEIVNVEDFFCERNVNAVVAWGKLYKKELFKVIRYPLGKLHEDEFTTYKLLFQYACCAFVDQPLYFYFSNPDSITKSGWSPKRLDALEAINNQKAFFKKMRLNKSYLFSLNENIGYIYCSYSVLFKSDFSDSIRYVRLLRKALRTNLRECRRKKMYMFSDKSSKYLYEIAYPKFMKVYWYWLAIKRNLKRK